ncbi:MAG: hypothetical protein ABIL23_00750 [candidate division WOR-3 bacterium]
MMLSRGKLFAYLFVLLLFVLIENIKTAFYNGNFDIPGFFSLSLILLPIIPVKEPERALEHLSLRHFQGNPWFEFIVPITVSILLFYYAFNPLPVIFHLMLMAFYFLFSYEYEEKKTIWHIITGHLWILVFVKTFPELLMALVIFWVFYPLREKIFSFLLKLRWGFGDMFLCFILGAGAGLISLKLL